MLRADPADTLTMCFWRVTVVRPACWSCLFCRKAKLMGQQDGGHLSGREGVLSSLVHCCSPSSALSRKQDLERNPGLRTRGGGGYSPAVCSHPPSIPLLCCPVLCWAHQRLHGVKHNVLHIPWMLSYGFSLLRQSPLAVQGKTVKITKATSARKGTGHGTRKIVSKMSAGFTCISGMGFSYSKV